MFVNAATNGVGCYRTAANKYFGNYNASEYPNWVVLCSLGSYLFSHTSVSEPIVCPPYLNCRRCAPVKIVVCCSLCHPECFPANMYLPSDGPPPARPRKTQVIVRDHNALAEKALCQRLEEWRETTVLARWGPDHPFGDGCLISDEQIQRIVNCAAVGILDSANAFRLEIPWIWSHIASYIDEILIIVKEFYPDQSRRKAPPAEPKTSQKKIMRITGVTYSDGDLTLNNSESPSVKVPKGRRCGACGEVGHISK